MAPASGFSSNKKGATAIPTRVRVIKKAWITRYIWKIEGEEGGGEENFRRCR